MTLKEFLDGPPATSLSAFARQIDVKPETVRRYVMGKRIPDRERMDLIVEATGGKVTANDFFGIAA